MSILYLMADLSLDSCYYRDVVAGVGRYCSEHAELRLRLPHAEWGLIGDNETIAGSIGVVDGPNWKPRYPGPSVNVSSRCWPVEYPTLTVDNRAAGRLAADHLVSQGYRHFAYHTETRLYFARARLLGFEERLKELKRSCAVFDNGTWDWDTTTPAFIHSQTVAWLQKLPKPVGLFCHNDSRASMLIDLCRESGLRVPDQVGVLGMDNDQMTVSTVEPPLSSIDPGAEIIGYRAAALLVGLIKGTAEYSAPILVPPSKLVERESTQLVLSDDETLAVATAYIRQHATDPITVDDVVDYAATSRRSLERRFRSRFGRSPGSEIRRVQIEKAKQLLADTDQPLNKIAVSCGYTRFRNFATAFCRETGTSPSTYRKAQRMQ